MTDRFELGTTCPHEEPTAQTGFGNWLSAQRMEAIAYTDQLLRTYGEPPNGVEFRNTTNPHDFGSYIDITLVYDDEVETHLEYLHKVEQGVDKWDDEAKRKLEMWGYHNIQKSLS
jgi:hypothetical protein